MDMGRVVERVRRLSDGELLAGLSGVLGGSRRLVALLLAHLAEVEERRLHLLAGYGSLFVYCTGGLGMSEDEAYRRIRVARLARRFSGVLELLAAGQVSLSVAALVEPHVTGANHVALLAAVSGKTVQQAREVLAAWYPKPDVLPFVRKLPERSSAVVGPLARRSGAVSGSARCDGNSDAGASSSALGGTLTDVGAPALPGGGERVLPAHAIDQVSTDESSRMTAASAVEHAAAGRARVALGALGATRARQSSSIVEPLSPGRYRVQFTADAELKRQIDLARDLLRHAVPQGDLATLVGRALDLLIETTLRRRFGKGSGNGEASKAVASARTAGAVAGDVHSSDRGSEREVLVNTRRFSPQLPGVRRSKRLTKADGKKPAWSRSTRPLASRGRLCKKVVKPGRAGAVRPLITVLTVKVLAHWSNNNAPSPSGARRSCMARSENAGWASTAGSRMISARSGGGAEHTPA